MDGCIWTPREPTEAEAWRMTRSELTIWDTGCGHHAYRNNSMDPRHEEYAFCPYCGEPLVQSAFSFSEVPGHYHVVGNKNCEEQWCGAKDGLPYPCACGGLVHAAFFEEYEDGYEITYCCDRCGFDYEFAED